MALVSTAPTTPLVGKRPNNPEGFTRNEKGKDIRHQNITAAKGESKVFVTVISR